MIVEHAQNSIVQDILESSDHEAVGNCLCKDNAHCDEEFNNVNLIE